MKATDHELQKHDKFTRYQHWLGFDLAWVRSSLQWPLLSLRGSLVRFPVWEASKPPSGQLASKPA
jgi:hypothetical protein